MADHHDVTTRNAADDIAEDDPLAELARIIGYERPQTPRQQVAPPETAPEIDVFDLEAELLRELEAPGASEVETAPPAFSGSAFSGPASSEIVDIPDVLAVERPEPEMLDSVEPVDRGLNEEFGAVPEAHTADFSTPDSQGPDFQAADLLGEEALFEALENELSADADIDLADALEAELADEESGEDELERQEDEWAFEDDVPERSEANSDEPDVQVAATYVSEMEFSTLDEPSVEAGAEDADLRFDADVLSDAETPWQDSSHLSSVDDRSDAEMPGEPEHTAGGWPEESESDIFESLLEWPEEDGPTLAEGAAFTAPSPTSDAELADEVREQLSPSGQHDDVLADITRFDIPDAHADQDAGLEQASTDDVEYSMASSLDIPHDRPEAEYGVREAVEQDWREESSTPEDALNAEENNVAPEAVSEPLSEPLSEPAIPDFADELSAELDTFQEEIGLSRTASNDSVGPDAGVDEQEPRIERAPEPEDADPDLYLDAELGSMLDEVFGGGDLDDRDLGGPVDEVASKDVDGNANDDAGGLSPLTIANILPVTRTLNQHESEAAILAENNPADWVEEAEEGNDLDSSAAAPDDGALAAFEMESHEPSQNGDSDEFQVAGEEFPEAELDSMSGWFDELESDEVAGESVSTKEPAAPQEEGQEDYRSHYREHSVVPFPGLAGKGSASHAAGVDMGADAFDPMAIQDASNGPSVIGDLDVPSIPEEALIADNPTGSDFDSEIEREFATLVEEEGGDLYAATSPTRTSDLGDVAGVHDFGDLQSGDQYAGGQNDAAEMTFRPRSIPVDADAPVSARPEENGADSESRRGPVIAFAVLGAAVILGLAGFGWNWISGDGASDGEVRIIRADNEPIKVVPDNPGGLKVPNQDKAVYDRVAGNDATGPAQPKLVDSSEEPVDVVQRTIDPSFLPMEGRTSEPDDGKIEDRIVARREVVNEPAPQSVGPLVAPRRVQTMVVLPDGTIVPRDEPEPEAMAETENGMTGADQTVDANAVTVASGADNTSAALAESTSTGGSLANGAGAGEGVSAGTVVLARTVETTTLRPEDVPVPLSRPTEQPLNVVATVTETGRVAAETEVVSDNTEPVANPGGYYMQIASQPTEEGAKASYRTLSSRYEEILADRGVEYQRADIPGKGIYHRVRIPAGDRTAASTLCSRYKDAGGSCFVTR